MAKRIGCKVIEKRWFFVLLVFICIEVWAGDLRVPLSPQDRVRLDHTLKLDVPWTPRLNQSIDGRTVILGVVLFDGTGNDRLNVADNERQTLVGHLYERLKDKDSISFLHYYRGVGTQSQTFLSLVDAATGYTLEGIAESAADKVIAALDALQFNAPETDVRLLVSGFSRGGAGARHFMNVLEQRWHAQERVGSPPRFYALIFDTVATGQRENLALQVPASADLFYHFLSIDERRLLFRPILDVPQNRGAGRIVTFPLPGAHSDVGGSYIEGVGSEYLANIDALLSAMGLLPEQCFSVDGDARAQGKHDSRWILERLLGIGAPGTQDEPRSRESFYIPASPLPDHFWSSWESRMLSLELSNGISLPRCIQKNGVELPEFRISREKGRLEVYALSSMYSPIVRITTEGGRYFMTYTYDGENFNKVGVAAPFLNGIEEGGSIKLSLAMVKDADGENHFWWFLNGERVQKIGE